MNLLFPAAFSLLVFLVSFVLVLVGRRQRGEGGAGRRHAFLAAAAGSALGVSPLVIGLTIYQGQDGRIDAFGFGFLGSILSIGWVLTAFRRPLPRHYAGHTLPELQDEGALARIAEISGHLRIRPPAARVVPTLGDSLHSLAWVGGLPAPTLVVTDGILHRLPPSERDGILAHELAHVSTGSLWVIASLVPLAAIAGVVSSLFAPVPVPLGVAFATFIGLRRIVGRRMEVVCDLEAARAVGHAEVAGALDKIHATHPLPTEGLLGWLVYSTATHPPLDVRRAALRRRAPAEAREEICVDRALVRRFRVGAALATIVWAATMVGAVVLGGRPGLADAACWSLIALGSAPVFLVFLGLLGISRRNVRRAGRTRLPGRRLTGASAVTVLAGALVFFATGSYAWLAAVFTVALLLLVAGRRRSRGLRILKRRIEAAMIAGEFTHVVEIARKNGRLLESAPALRLQAATAAAVAGDRAFAGAELERLTTHPCQVPMALLQRARFLLDEEDVEGALVLAERAAERLPADAVPHISRASALWALDRVDEAAAAIERARELDPRDGGAVAFAARIAARRGKPDLARVLMEKAHSLAPGDAFPLLVAAEVAASGEDCGTALAAAEAALDAARANPYSQLEGRAGKLLEAARGRTGAHPSPGGCNAGEG